MRCRYWDVVLFRIGDEVTSPFEFPLAPRSNHFDIRLKSIEGEFKTHLVIPFAGSAMGHCICTFSLRDLDLAFGNHWSRKRSPEKINAFIDGVRFECCPD